MPIKLRQVMLERKEIASKIFVVYKRKVHQRSLGRLFLKIMLLFYLSWYTHRQHPKCQRLSFSHSDETFAHFSLASGIGEAGSLYMLGCFVVVWLGGTEENTFESYKKPYMQFSKTA
jgi:hypothetical protein